MNKKKIINRLILKNTINKIEYKATLLGKDEEEYAASFLYYRYLFCIIIVLACFLVNNRGLIIAPFAVIIFYYISEYLIFDLEIINRKYQLEKDTIFFLEALSMTLENNQNLMTALKITCNSLDNTITKELKRALNKMDLGYSFKDAMTKLKQRIPSESIRTVLLKLMKSANEDDNDSKLESQIEYLRNEYFLERKNSISKLPLRLIIISIIFYIPLILILIFVPILM